MHLLLSAFLTNISPVSKYEMSRKFLCSVCLFEGERHSIDNTRR